MPKLTVAAGAFEVQVIRSGSCCTAGVVETSMGPTAWMSDVWYSKGSVISTFSLVGHTYGILS